jgi:hypothetical protein
MPDLSMNDHPVADAAAGEPNPSAAEQADSAPPPVSAFERILARATDLGVSDLAEQHDHYLYGAEKQ